MMQKKSSLEKKIYFHDEMIHWKTFKHENVYLYIYVIIYFSSSS